MEIYNETFITTLIASYSGFLLATAFFTSKYEPENFFLSMNTSVILITLVSVALFFTAAYMQTVITETYKKV